MSDDANGHDDTEGTANGHDDTETANGHDDTEGTAESAIPAAMAPPVAAVADSAAAASGWPKGAKTTAAVLAIIAVLGVIGAIVGFSQASSSDDDKSAAEQDVDAANVRADAAEQERDSIAEQASGAQADIDSLNGELGEAAAANDQLSTDLSAATERAETAETQIADAEARIAEAQAQIEEAGGLLPVGIDSSLIPEDLPGNYAITFAEPYCDGFPTCGVLPTQNQARIYSTPEGFLRVEVPGILDAGLFALEGSLYGITDSFTALPQCDGVDQRARVTVTLFARGITIDAPEGEVTRTVDTLNASITIDAPRLSDACPSGLVFYASSFAPTG